MREKIIVKENKVVYFDGKDNKNYVEKAIKENLDFFGDIKTSFEVIFLETREEMDNVSGMKTQEWVVGGNYGDDKIYIFSENVFDKVSIHSKKDFFHVLVHEIAHIYSSNCFNFHLPIWLNEGIAYVVANQDLIQELKEVDKVLESYSEREWMKNYPYSGSGRFVRYLINKYGKEKIIELMKKLDFLEKKPKFEKKFKDIYGKDIYEVFGEFKKSLE